MNDPYQSRNFVAVPKSAMPPPPVPSPSKPQRGKRKSKPSPEKRAGNTFRKKRKVKGKGFDNDELSSSTSDDPDDIPSATQPRRSTRMRKNPDSGYLDSDDEEMSTGNPPGPSETQVRSVNENEPEPPRVATDMDVVVVPSSTLELEEEEKPKLALQLKYQGFDIFGYCLCIVVEPWPPIRAPSKALSIAQPAIRAPSIAPASDSGVQKKTPLFLPDFDQERGETPAPPPQHKVTRLPISSLLDPNFLEDSDDSDYGGMMEFSQVLNSTGDFRAGAADDDEDTDAAMFFR